MKIVYLNVLCLLISASAFSSDKASSTLSVGSTAPDFSLPYATKDSIASAKLTLSELIDKLNIVLAFYPADWSSGCTKEVCTMRDDWGTLSDLNVEILGISGDYVYSHHEWAKHHNLPFKLLSDHSHEVAKTYDSYNDASGYNKRTVYVIDKNGKIAYIDMLYSVRDMESFNKLRDALRKLK